MVGTTNVNAEEEGSNVYTTVDTSYYSPVESLDFGSTYTYSYNAGKTVPVINSDGLAMYGSEYLYNGRIGSYGTSPHTNQGSILKLTPNRTTKSAYFMFNTSSFDEIYKISFKYTAYSSTCLTNLKSQTGAIIRLEYLDFDNGDWVTVGSSNLLNTLYSSSYYKTVSVSTRKIGYYRFYVSVPFASSTSTSAYAVTFDDINIYSDENVIEKYSATLSAKTESDDIIDTYLSKYRTDDIENRDYIPDDWDMEIVNIIPKDFFFRTGTHAYMGKEWGFVVITEAINSNDIRYSDVFIFDVQREEPGLQLDAADLAYTMFEEGIVKERNQSLTQISFAYAAQFVSTDIRNYHSDEPLLQQVQLVRNAPMDLFSANVKIYHDLYNMTGEEASRAKINYFEDVTGNIHTGVNYNETLLLLADVFGEAQRVTGYADPIVNAVSKIQPLGAAYSITGKVLSAGSTITDLLLNWTAETYKYMTYGYNYDADLSADLKHYGSSYSNIHTAGDYYRQLLTYSSSDNEMAHGTKIMLDIKHNGVDVCTLTYDTNETMNPYFNSFQTTPHTILSYVTETYTSNNDFNTFYKITPSTSATWKFTADNYSGMTVYDQYGTVLFSDSGKRIIEEYDDVGDIVYSTIYVSPTYTRRLSSGQTYYIFLSHRLHDEHTLNAYKYASTGGGGGIIKFPLMLLTLTSN